MVGYDLSDGNNQTPIKVKAMPRLQTIRPHCLVLAQNTPVVCQGYLPILTSIGAAPRHVRGPVAIPGVTYGCVQC